MAIFISILVVSLVQVPVYAKRLDCWSQLYDEANISPEKMKVYKDKMYYGDGNRLDIGCKVAGVNSWPTVFVLYSSGYLRLKYPQSPDNTFGSSFVLGPGYWSGGSYYHNPQITEVKFDSKYSKMTVKAENEDFEMEYRIKMSIKKGKIYVSVKEYVKAKNTVVLDQARMQSGEAFKVIQVSSMYVDVNNNDMEYVEYRDNSKIVNTVYVANKDGFILSNPAKLKKPVFDFVNKPNASPWQVPTVSIVAKIKGSVAQGYVRKTSDSNDDNVGFWIGDGMIGKTIPKGSKLKYSYVLSAQN